MSLFRLMIIKALIPVRAFFATNERLAKPGRCEKGITSSFVILGSAQCVILDDLGPMCLHLLDCLFPVICIDLFYQPFYRANTFVIIADLPCSDNMFEKSCFTDFQEETIPNVWNQVFRAFTVVWDL